MSQSAVTAGFTCSVTKSCQVAYVREAGDGAPVVCIHSSASSSAQWRSLIDRLATRFRMIAVDLYGSGRSPAWSDDRPLTLADEVALIEPVIAATGRRVHLVGHSYGGAVALKLALEHPDWLESLVVFEPVLFSLLMAHDPDEPGAREIHAVRDDTCAAAGRGDLDAAGSRFVDYWMGAGTWASLPAARRGSIAAAMAPVQNEWHALFAEPAPLHAFAGLDLPTLCLVGSDSPASSRRVAQLLVKTLPRVVELELEGVGHMGPITHPELVNELIARHVDGHAGRG